MTSANAATQAPRARVERAALELFTSRGFDAVTADEVADAAGISRRTFFRYYPTKADAVWGDFAAHVARLDALLRSAVPGAPVLGTVCTAYADVNDYGPADLPVLRQRMRLILTEPALQAHSQLRYAEIDRVVAEHVARSTGEDPSGLLPRLVAASTRAAATTAFAAWLADDRADLGVQLHRAFDELATGFPSLGD
ncbi:mycofactocin system transcriptional regulator [Blastococcus sp. TF02-8]|uniref:mycofactocin system transcriptional regulator n=1 Tax=Blastococcus sp. TF02-8 TaxID=2250574 RepID=UPI002682C8F6|nr:mycofactocin system transcriptional regulator [Blastococcus sp. TF02-8]